MPRADLAHLAHVLDGEGLTADKVRRCLHAHEGDLLRPVPREEVVQLIDVDIALERGRCF